VVRRLRLGSAAIFFAAGLLQGCPFAVTDRYSREPPDAVELCGDEQLDGDESDVDCGGPDCNPCMLDRRCRVDRDCLSNVCASGSCAREGCSDGRQDGRETDEDCGGACAPCAVGDACLLDADCVSGSCLAGVCQ
jgi:hypothetical protein